MTGKHKIFLICMGLVFIIAGSTALFIFIGMSQPANGVIDTSASTTQTKKFDMTPHLAVGKYASFQYPADMTVKKNNPIVFPVTEQFNYTYRDIQSWLLAVAIISIPSGKLIDNNAYQFRKTKPDQYKESTITVGDQDIVVMTDANAPGFSKIAFLVHGGQSATISLFGDSPLGVSDLEKTFLLVLSTWHWQPS